MGVWCRKLGLKRHTHVIIVRQNGCGFEHYASFNKKIAFGGTHCEKVLDYAVYMHQRNRDVAIYDC